MLLTPENRVRQPVDEKRLQRQPNINILFQQMEIIFEMSECPPGFILKHINKSCTCEKLLLDHSLQCNLDTVTVFRKEQNWVSVTYDNVEHNRSHGTIFHEYCPHDYCRRDDESLTLNLEHPMFSAITTDQVSFVVDVIQVSMLYLGPLCAKNVLVCGFLPSYSIWFTIH